MGCSEMRGIASTQKTKQPALLKAYLLRVPRGELKITCHFKKCAHKEFKRAGYFGQNIIPYV